MDLLAVWAFDLVITQSRRFISEALEFLSLHFFVDAYIVKGVSAGQSK
jgi:hypothetical protein